MKKIVTDICVIGAGSGGLSTAAGAAQMGASVVLIEKNKLGGECLNTGCVPSKSLITASQHMQLLREGHKVGVKTEDSSVDYKKINDYIKSVINKIAVHDSIERFENMGVKVIRGFGRFINKREVKVDDTVISARYFVVATGSSPAIPDISGLKGLPFLTNESIFALQEKPEHLIVIGGGSIGCEIAQAYNFLGARVTIIQRSNILKKDDPELVSVVREKFLEAGIKLYEHTELKSVEHNGEKYKVFFKHDEKDIEVDGSHLLIASGRSPNIQKLDLEKAGISYTERGIVTNKRMKTTNRHVFAIGDSVGKYQFTHAANYQAGIVLRNILFKIPAKVDYTILPWATFTTPELVHVGLQEEEAKIKHRDVKVLRFDFAESDRAQTENDITGMVKVIATNKGAVLGVSMVGRGVSELITPWTLAIKANLKLKDLATIIIPYPTRSEIIKQVAGEFYKPLLQSSKIKKLVRFLLKFS